MDVRLVRPTDAPLVLSLSVDERAHIVGSAACLNPGPAALSMVRAALPIAVTGRMWLAKGAHGIGIAEARPRRYVIGWDLTRLAFRGDAERVLGPLLHAVTAHLQERGVPRLFARCRESAQTELHRLEFSTLARELTMMGSVDRHADDTGLPLESRYRMRQDDWPLHQLESEVTPALIRQIEGLTSVDWSRPIRARSEIVVEREGRVVAWVGWGAIECGKPRIAMLLHPQHADLGPALLRHAERHNSSGLPLITRVREYQTDVVRVFREAGFRVVDEELLMVKHASVEPVRVLKRSHVAVVPSVQAFRSTTGAVLISSGRASTSAQKET